MEKMGKMKEKPVRSFSYGPTTDAILNHIDNSTYFGKNFGHCTTPQMIEQKRIARLRGQKQT